MHCRLEFGEWGQGKGKKREEGGAKERRRVAGSEGGQEGESGCGKDETYL